MSERVECPGCGDGYLQLGNHWNQSSICSHPPFSQEQKELLKGLTMGDGSINVSNWDGGDSSMKVSSINRRWLEWLDAKFGAFSAGIRLEETGEDIGRRARQYSTFDDSGGEWEYNDIYSLSLRTHPFLTAMRKRWYPGDSIRYPEDLHLTPTSATAWYCSDGGLSWTNNGVFVVFGTHNEANRPEFLCRLLQDHGFTTSYSEPLVRVSSTQAADVLEWMGTAPAGFEYKWACDSRERYRRLKDGVAAAGSETA